MNKTKKKTVNKPKKSVNKPKKTVNKPKKKIYCGILPLKKDQQYGSMKQCAEKKQIRRFGKFKVDQRLLDENRWGDDKVTLKNNRNNLIVEVSKLRGRIARLTKDYEDPQIKRTERLTIKHELDKTKKELHETLQKFKKSGGALKAKDIHDFIVDSRDVKGKDVNDFKIDKELSSASAKVYFNPVTKQSVVVHRGTNTFEDVITDVGALLGLESHDRFGNSYLTQEKAMQKYGAPNVSTIGFSLGGLLAHKYGIPSREIITYNPFTLLNNRENAPNEFTIKTNKDVISALKKPHVNDVVIPVDSINPAETHKLDYLKKLDDNQLIGHGMNLEPSTLNKMTVKQLKKTIKSSNNKIKITGLKKSDLINICQSLY
jgi:hypothetical protein